MPGKSKNPDHNYIPTDYDDLYIHYIRTRSDGGPSLCQTLIRSFMPFATPDEMEELAQEVALRLMEHNMLARFDPAKSNFGGVIFFTTRTVCVNHLKKKGRNPITGLNGGSLMETDPEDGEFVPGMWSLDRLFGTETPDREAQLDARHLIERLYDWAAGLAANPQHKRDESLLQVIQMMATQSDAKEMGKALGVTPSTIHNWLGVIKAKAIELREATA